MNRQLLKYHPVIGYTFIPNLRARVPHESGGYLLRTNGLGFRCDKEPGETLADNHRSVAVFGDSFTAGDGVSNPKRYTNILEQLLPDVRVYNFGLSGTGTDQQYLVYRTFAKEFHWDAVVISVLVENIRRTVARYRPFLDSSGDIVYYAKPYYTLTDDSALQLHHQPVPSDPIRPEQLSAEKAKYVDTAGAFPRLRRFANALGGGVKNSLQKVSRFQPVPQYSSPDNPEWLLQRKILEQWISEIDVPIILLILPVHQFVEETADAAPTRMRYRELVESFPRVELVDPLDELWRLPRKTRRSFRFAKDVHPTPAYHSFLAQILSKPLSERLGIK